MRAAADRARGAICSPVRTPVGRFGGVFRGLPAVDLAAATIRAVLERTGPPPERVDDVPLGQCYPNGLDVLPVGSLT